jgi:hypothetical protein
MAKIRILDPTAVPPEVTPDPGPDAGALPGRLVGIRFDTAWPSFEWVMDEWAQRLRDAGAEVRTWCAGNRIGEEGDRTAAELETFATDVDVAIIGLGN